MFSCYPSDPLSILVRILFRPLLEISSKFSICDFDLSILPSAFAGEPWAFLPTPYDMDWTTTPLGHASNGLEIGFKSNLDVARTLHESPPARPHRPLFPDISGVSHRRLRQIKSDALPRKRHETVMDIITRVHSVATNRPAEKNSSPGGSPRRVEFTAHISMYRETYQFPVPFR